jgi:L-Ala-D/L-Glu epimerase
MQLMDLSMQPLAIPFRLEFVHASAARRCTQAVVVAATTAGGVVGYGEGCPRSYVTGESLESAMGFFARHRRQLLEVRQLTDVQRFMASRHHDIEANPAAFAAVELALLDAIGRSEVRSVESLLGQPELVGEFCYSAVIGLGSLEVFRLQLQEYARLKLRDLKIKLCGDLASDRARVTLAVAAGMRIRVDANNLWQSPVVAAKYISILAVPLLGVEEPLQPHRLEDLAKFVECCGVPVILDESLPSLEQLPRIATQTECFVLNLRVSRIGGLWRSLALAKLASSYGFQLIVGAHVGETSILTRAGLTLAAAAGKHLIAHEGAFGTHLLANDVCVDSLTWGVDGRLPAPAVRPGMGLAVQWLG